MAVILADDIFKRIFLNENIIISIKISLQFVSKGLIDNKPALHGSGNGLEPNRRQDITCSNEDPIYPLIYAALGGDELKIMVTKKYDNNEYETLRIINKSRTYRFSEKNNNILTGLYWICRCCQTYF